MSARIERFTVRRTPQLEVRLPSGSLHVRTGDADEVLIEVEGRRADEFNITQSGGAIVVEHDGRRGVGTASHQVHITTPTGSGLSARVASADISTDGELGSVRLATASGDARIGSTVASLEAKTASGRLSADMVTGGVRVRTASGNVEIETATREVSVVTASGNVRIADALGDVTAKTASGRIAIDRFDGDLCAARTVSGGVRIGVPPGRTVQVDLSSLSGKIDLPSEPSEPSEPSGTGTIRP